MKESTWVVVEFSKKKGIKTFIFESRGAAEVMFREIATENSKTHTEIENALAKDEPDLDIIDGWITVGEAKPFTAETIKKMIKESRRNKK